MKKIAALFLFGVSPAFFAADSTLVSGAAITPAEAIEKATASADGASGVFEMVVRNVEAESGGFVLYSESDPRDRRCLAVYLFPSALKEMLKESGLEPAVNFQGKKIRVRGATDTTKRAITDDAKNKFGAYYQRVFVPVFHAKNLVVVR